MFLAFGEVIGLDGLRITRQLGRNPAGQLPDVSPLHADIDLSSWGFLCFSQGFSPVSQNLLTYDDLQAKGIRLSKVQLWRNERAGKFPRRVVISHQRIAWIESEIDEFVAARIAARPAREPVAA
jgi:prophage regulatory protein